MDLNEILGESLMYPFKNIRALLVYVVLGIILGIVAAGTLAAIAAGAAANNLFAIIGSGIIGFIVSIFLVFVISGYELDIIQYGIERRDAAPDLDFIRQFINGVKFFVVSVVYLIIPIIIGAILAIIFQHWLVIVIMAIVSIVFALALMMAECRLAKTEDLFYALAINEAIADIKRVGIFKVIVFVILVTLFSLVLSLVGGFISEWNTIVGGIITGVIGIYFAFFVSRATGLLYSDV